MMAERGKERMANLLRRRRFSLRTALLGSLLIGSAAALWVHWAPWFIVALLPSSDDKYPRGCISPDGKWIAVTTSNAVQLWDAQRATPHKTIPCKEPLLEFSPDSKTVLAGITQKDSVKYYIWDIASGTKKFEGSCVLPDSHKLGFNHDSTKLLDRFHVGLWNLSDGEEIFCVGLNGASFSYVYVADEVRETKMSTAMTLHELAGFTQDLVLSGAVSDDRRIVAINILGWQTLVWDLSENRKLCSVKAVDFDSRISGDGGLLATRVYGESCFNLWDTRTGKMVSKLFTGLSTHPAEPIMGEFAFSPDGELLGCTTEGKLFIWETRTGVLKNTNTPNEFAFRAFLPDNTRVLVETYVGEEGPFLKILDAQSSKSLFRFHTETEGGSREFHISPDGSQILADYSETEMALWRRRRPEWWWGVAYLPEFWLTLVFALAFLWSVRRDWGELKGQKGDGGMQKAEVGVQNSLLQN